MPSEMEVAPTEAFPEILLCLRLNQLQEHRWSGAKNSRLEEGIEMYAFLYAM